MPAPIQRETILHTTPEDAYAAFTDPACIRNWFAETVIIDGDHWRYEWPGGLAAEGRYVETDPPHRLVWTWELSSTTSPDGTTESMTSNVVLAYTFEAVEDGTRFRIHESGHDTEDLRTMNECGVESMLETLSQYLEHGKTVDWEHPPTE